MSCGRDDIMQEPPLPARIIWGSKVTYHDEQAISELKRRLERSRQENAAVARELACYRQVLPGYWYSKRHNMLVDVEDIDDGMD